MKVELKHIDLASMVKVCFVIYAIVGIFVGLLYLVFALVFGSLLDYTNAFGGTSFLRVAAAGFGVLLVPLFALLYGCIGALGGLVVAVVYNLACKTLGGVKLTFEAPGTGSVSSGLSDQAEMRL